MTTTRLLLAALVILGGTEFEAQAAAPPNLLLAIADDVSYPHQGAYGCSWVRTPGFDRVAREGLLFTRAYTPNAKCAPSRACLLTGRNSWQLGAAANHVPFFPLEYKTYAEALAEQGWFVGKTGKGWAPGVAVDAQGRRRQLAGRAFDRRQLDPPTPVISRNDYAGNFEEFLDAAPAGQPWCFWYGSTEPHRPYAYGSGVALGGKQTDDIDRVPGFWPDTERVRNDLLDYAFALEHFDRHLVRMLSSLEQRGLLDNTLVVVTADHGMPFPRAKGQAYDFSNHVPLAIRWPSGIKQPGRVIADYVSFIDLAPTFIEVSGLAWGDLGLAPTPGRSLTDIFQSADAGPVNPARDHVLIGKERHDVGRPHDWGYPIRGIVKQDQLYLRNYELSRWPAGNPETGYLNCDGSPTKTEILERRRAGGQDSYWDLAFGKRPAEELYDLRTDRDCLDNLAGRPETEARRTALAAELEARLQAQDDPRMRGEGYRFEQEPYAGLDHRNFHARYRTGEKLRAGWVNPSDFEVEETYDLVVYGGTASGVIAAVQAARLGRSVLLIEPTSRLGGLTTGGLGQTDIGNKRAIGGLAREFYRAIRRHYDDPAAWTWQSRAEYRDGGQTRTAEGEDAMWTFEPSVALEVLKEFLREASVPVAYGERLDLARGVEKRGNRIERIRMESGRTIRGQMFIDATYEGDLMALAGVTTTVGREPNSQYGETLNGVQTAQDRYHQLFPGVDPYVRPGDPESGLLPGIDPTGPGAEGSGDRRVQAYCFRMCLTDHPDNRIPFQRPEGYREVDYELLLRNFEAGERGMPWINSDMPNRKTDTNNRTGFSTDFIGQNYDYPEADYATREEIVRRHRHYQQGLMWTLANHPRVPESIRNEVSRWGMTRDEFVEYDGWQEQLYIREARRMIGRLVMTQLYCQGNQVADDSVGLGAYGMDSHHVQRYVDAHGHVRNEGDVQVGGFPPYPIAYRAITPREEECANLLVPVCLSASHIAFGSIRMEPVFMVLGQSAATAAVQALEENRAVQHIDVEELQSSLRNEGQVLEWIPDLLPATWPSHPRLIATEPAWAELQRHMAADPGLQAFVNALVTRARASLAAPPPERRLEGRRLLGVSREVLRRVLLHAFAYRLTGQVEFRDRAKTDLLAVAAFADWNPAHFLDVAEMATAVAFGYDWLHHELAEEEKATLRRALVEKALNHGRNGHASFRSRNNWNQVCIGGLTLAALAIGDKEPDLARSILAAAHRNLDHGLEAYRPDGIYPEGPSYWEYGTSYTVLLVAALRSATGGDWGILKNPALRASAPWVVHMTGPSGRFYNFADGGARGGLMPALFFFARELNQPALLQFQHSEARDFAAGGSARLAPLAAFWWLTSKTPTPDELPRFWSGNGRQPIAVWRSSWNDPGALYFAIKAGGAAANHAHMDGGSFILEANGVRWAEDPGLQSYHSLESRGVQLWSMHQDSQRWQIFRLGPFAHNTLTFDGELHNASGMATFNHADAEGADIDLTPIFLPGNADRVRRRVNVADRSVGIEDSIEGAKPGARIRWAMVTRAGVEIAGTNVVLRQDDQQLAIEFNGAQPVVLDISEPASPLDAPNPGMRLLAAHTTADAAGRAKILVRLTLSPAVNPSVRAVD